MVWGSSLVFLWDHTRRRVPQNPFCSSTVLGWTPKLDVEWWKPHDNELLCMQPKNDYFGSQIVAGRCKKHNSKQQWEIVGEKVRKAEQ